MNDQYKTISETSQSVFRDKGSRFIAQIIPVNSETEVKERLEELRKQYHDARHHCYAYRIGPEGELWRTNDDGEPSGSAGKPILGQLLSFEISDILAVVIRYFGGTKLGIPGLINAYRTATREAIGAGVIAEKLVTSELEISFEYPVMNHVMRCVKEYDLEMVSTEFENECSIVCKVRKSILQEVTDTLLKAEKLKCSVVPVSANNEN